MNKELFQNELFDALAGSSDRVFLYMGDLFNGGARWSKAAVDFFGMPDEYIEDVNAIWVPKIHPDDVEAYMSDLIRMEKGESDEHNCQYRVTNKQGKYIWVECRGKLLKGKDGKPTLFTGVITCLDNRNKYDALTGVYTTHEFYNRDLTGKKGHFLLIGIDEFRNIVSSYGYTFGDAVLVEIARRLEEMTSESGRVYRFNGDEFLVVYSDTTEDDIRCEFGKIKNSLAEIKEFKDHILNITATGGAIYYQDDGKKVEDYINDLESSLEIAKQKHRGDVVFFSEEVEAIRIRKKTLREDLVISVRNNFAGFELFFQPLVDNVTGRISGCESLLRWKGERIKDSYPGEFIAVLEDNGLIKKVGGFVMEAAIDQLKEWEEKYGEIKVSLNISYQQFMEPGFTERLINKVRESGINPEHLVAELTESCEVEKPETLAENFKRIRAEGIQVALDDFGTAYSSMELLKVLPANYIKIEHMFVRDLEEKGHEIDYIIIENILALCDRLKFTSVVEGVETENVEKIVKKLNPTYLQGYYYSKPVNKEQFEAMLEKDRGIG
ncbi:MAG: GGDEF and EAL domain-containing protein [Lachnospiraceae bacterium]|nr:GGDEF and EAL domain-containing protein [Lachnospiraceae bacterium]